MRGRRDTSGGGIIGWLLPAMLLHAAALLLAPSLSRGPSSAEPPPGADVRHSSMELTLLDVEEWARASPAVHASSAPGDTSNRAAFDSSGAVASRAAELARLSARGASDISGSAPALPGGEASARARAGVNEPVADAPATLSLDQLGIGTNPFMAFTFDSVSEPSRANARLQASLQRSEFESERQRGLRPEGPVVEAARRLVLADDVLVETSAVFNVRVDGGGRVTGVHVMEVSSHVRAWQSIAARLADALGPLKPLEPASAQGWGVKLRLASSMQLPSGAAPGFRMGVLGQTLAGSGGPGSASLSLSPTAPLVKEDEPVDPIGRHMDDVVKGEVGLLVLKGDIADIAAPARRVVRVAVLSIDESPAP